MWLAVNLIFTKLLNDCCMRLSNHNFLKSAMVFPDPIVTFSLQNIPSFYNSKMTTVIEQIMNPERMDQDGQTANPGFRNALVIHRDFKKQWIAALVSKKNPKLSPLFENQINDYEKLN